jgi:hypothetical protein
MLVLETSFNSESKDMVIDVSTQNVGIGTTSGISSKLTVNGNAAIGYTGYAAPSNGLIVNGDIGIGITSPSYGLHIHGKGIGISKDGAPNLTFKNIQVAGAGNNSGQISFYAQNNAATPESILYSTIQGKTDDVTDGSEDGHLEFLTMSGGSISERVRISSDGNFGIGTTSPGQKLEVNGGIQVGDTSTATSGTIRFNSGKLQVYQNSAWRDIQVS